MRITIQFIDGPYDGTVSFDDSEDPSRDATTLFAWSFFERTKGNVGCWGGGLAPASREVFNRLIREKGVEALKGVNLTHHEYHVTDRQESEDGLHIKAKYTTVPRGDETTTWVIAHRVEDLGRVTLVLGGLALPDYQYKPEDLVTIHTSIYQFKFGPPPERETPLTAKRATWNGEEYVIEKASIEQRTIGARTEHMTTIVLVVETE